MRAKQGGDIWAGGVLLAPPRGWPWACMEPSQCCSPAEAPAAVCWHCPVNGLTGACPAAGRSGPALCSGVLGDAGHVCQALLTSEPWRGLRVPCPRLQRARAAGQERPGHAAGPAARQGGTGQDAGPGLDLAPRGRDSGARRSLFHAVMRSPITSRSPSPARGPWPWGGIGPVLQSPVRTAAPLWKRGCGNC